MTQGDRDRPDGRAPPARATLSVVLIARDEAPRIGRALGSVSWADEIVVIDSGSTDRTVEICRELGAIVEVAGDWPGFGPQKNRALDRATCDWILSIDADEVVSPELADEIRTVLASGPTADVFRIPRLSSLLGRPMRHGDWWPDEIPRLFRRGAARFSDDAVHESLVFEGGALRLRGLLLHDSIRSLEQMLDKVNHYTSAGAAGLARRGRKGGLRSALGHGAWAFVRAYVLRRGFLDGREGFIAAVSAAESAYYRYLKRFYLE
jgi:glycosyltransferase involved in cell wall biosynthesis